MQLHELQGISRKISRRVGRGGKRGTFSGRGTKGQKARSGRRIRPQFRDILMKLPKRRGYRFNAFREKPVVVNISILDIHFAAGDKVTPLVLKDKGIISERGGKMPAVKILGSGDITKKLSIEGCEVSIKAKDKIEKAGGSIATQ
jgi:large subunit ribosomal protein L15